MRKVLYVGNGKTWGGRGYKVFLEMEYTEGKLSISGVEGPLPSGNALGSCGQIQDELLKIEPAPGFNRATLKRLHDYWEEWHLNNLQAGCEHQRAARWDEVKLDDSKPLTQDNMAIWTHPETRKHRIARLFHDNKILYAHLPKKIKHSINKYAFEKVHPRGLLCKPCPVCGYKYGTQWLRKEVPASVINWLFSLPDSPITPAWV